MKILISESQLRSLFENIDDESVNVLSTYLSEVPSLIPIYEDIEKQLGEKFKPSHFEQEIQYSDGLKPENGSLSPDALSSFKLMLKNNNLTGTVKYHPDSYRDYNLQKKYFLKYANKYGAGKKIDGALTRAALPGFSQHHTGKALDFSPSYSISNSTLKKYGFIRPYPIKTSFRMEEPWHILYTL